MHVYIVKVLGQHGINSDMLIYLCNSYCRPIGYKIVKIFFQFNDSSWLLLIVCVCVCLLLEIKPKALHKLDKHSTTESLTSPDLWQLLGLMFSETTFFYYLTRKLIKLLTEPMMTKSEGLHHIPEVILLELLPIPVA